MSTYQHVWAYLIDPERWAWSSTLGNDSTKDILDGLEKFRRDDLQFQKLISLTCKRGPIE